MSKTPKLLAWDIVQRHLDHGELCCGEDLANEIADTISKAVTKLEKDRDHNSNCFTKAMEAKEVLISRVSELEKRAQQADIARERHLRRAMEAEEKVREVENDVIERCAKILEQDCTKEGECIPCRYAAKIRESAKKGTTT